MSSLFQNGYLGNPADDPMCLHGSYQPPATFRPWTFELVATLPKVPGGDGYDVEMYEMRGAGPARFYRMIAVPTRNSLGVEHAGWALETGSGAAMGRLIEQIAKAAVQGMIGPKESLEGSQ